MAEAGSRLAILFAPTDSKNISHPIVVVRGEGLVLCSDHNLHTTQAETVQHQASRLEVCLLACLPRSLVRAN
jgi:hypothetical protein